MSQLHDLRRKINQIDQKLSQLLQERFEVSSTIQALKKEQKLPKKDPQREKEIIEKLENDYEKEIFKKILEESKKK